MQFFIAAALLTLISTACLLYQYWSGAFVEMPPEDAHEPGAAEPPPTEQLRAA